MIPLTPHLPVSHSSSPDRSEVSDLRAPEPGPFHQPTWPFKYVDTLSDLKALATKLEKLPLISIDTETVGDRRVLGSEILCWIQIGVPAMKGRGKNAVPDPTKPGTTHLIAVRALQREADRLELERKEPVNPLTALRAVLESEQTKKLAHHSQFERGQFDKYAITFRGVIDTKVEAKWLRRDMPSYSLQACMLEILGKLMSKEEQTSNWETESPTPAQEPYLRLDAEAPFQLYWAIDSRRAALRKAETVAAPTLDWKTQVGQLLEEISKQRTERLAVLEGARLLQPVIELSARAEAYRASLGNQLRESALLPNPPGYRGPYGVAEIKQYDFEEPDYALLEQLLPHVARKVIREETTRKKIEEVVRAENPGIKAKDQKAQVEEIWKVLNRGSGEYSEPKLKLKISGPPDLESEIKKAAKELHVPSQPLSETLAAIMEADLTRLELLRAAGIANEVELYDRQIELYAGRILELLVENTAEGKHSNTVEAPGRGTASYQQRERTKLDIAAFREQFPEMAEKTLARKITKGALRAALRAEGADPQTTDKQVKQLFKSTGEHYHRTSVHPNYSLYYKGLEEDPEELADQESPEEGIEDE